MSIPTNNLKEVAAALISVGLKNQNVLIGSLCCIAKESGFVPKDEYSYRNTDNIRLRKLFGHKLEPYNEDQLTVLKHDDIKFFDVVYGNMLGNAASGGDGFKYRGRGFNQITFKKLYEKYGILTKEDLINYPEKLDDIKIAAKACAFFFSEGYKNTAGNLLSRYGLNHLEDVKDVNTAIAIAVNCNAGWAHDTRGGMFEKAAQAYLSEVTNIFNSLKVSLNI